ncbi:MAG: DNA translocase FtsK 4TM domain-containing protein [Bacteroidetes bacterium]|nr:DNA translocase FtsK 4TM domain-containing protein [Bacteroidota bacterium]
MLFLLFCIFLCVSFYSYFFTWKLDQDKVFNQNNLWHFLSDNSHKVLNSAGKLGAYFSHQLIFNGFGLATWFLVPLFAILGLNLMLSKRVYPTLKAFFFSGISILLMAPILAYFFQIRSFPFPMGELLEIKLSRT